MNKSREGRNIELLILAITGACNFSCSYCYASHQTEEAMDMDILEQACRLVKGNKKKVTVQFTGGEPLLAFDRMQRAIELMESLDVPVSYQLQTNGSLITEAIANYLKRHKVAVGISLDGTPAINDALRASKDGISSTMKTVKGIRTLAEAGVAIGITCVVTKSNVACLDELIDFAYYMGNVRKIGFNLLRPQGRGESLESLSPEEVQKGVHKALLRVNKLEKMTGINMTISQLERICQMGKGHEPFSHCYALHKTGIYVNPKGELYACASLSGREEYCLGHVFYGVEEDKEKALIEKLRPIVSICQACSHVKDCGGACYSRAPESDVISLAECAFKRTCIDYYRGGLKNK